MLPNFLIVGAAKAGTTSVYEYLKQHPNIFMSNIKEPYFFTFVGKKPNFRGPFDKKTNESGIITDLLDKGSASDDQLKKVREFFYNYARAVSAESQNIIGRTSELQG